MASWSFNPFTGNLDITGGGAVVLEGEVETFADLPETIGDPAVGSSYLVRTSTGVWLVNRRQAGIWIRRNNTGVRATDWEYGGDYPVNSVNGQSGNVVLGASDVGAAATLHAFDHEAGEADEIQAMAALVTTDVAALNGVYFHDGTTTSGRPNFFKTGTRKNTKIQWNNSTGVWELFQNLTVVGQSEANSATRPWSGGTWEDPRSPQVITSITVTRLGLEDMVQKLAETGAPATATTSEDGLLSASDKTKLNNLGTASTKDVAPTGDASSTQVVLGSDTRLSDARTPSSTLAHKASHATGGSDALAPSDIGAQSLFTSSSQILTSDVTLTGGRATKVRIQNYNGTTYNVTLPTSDVRVGDVIVITAGTLVGPQTIREQNIGGSSFSTLATLRDGQSYRFISVGTDSNSWEIDEVYTHTHTPSDVGLGNVSNTAQVTSVSGTAPIVSSGGTTPAISITDATTTASGAMSSADKTKLDGIASGATANSPDATLLARANHTGTQAASTITGLAAIATSGSASDLGSGTVPIGRLGASGTPSGSTYLAGDNSWKAVSGGVSAVDSTTADVFSVSGSNLVADDGGTIDSADPFVKWDDTAGKLVYANPLTKPSGRFHVGLAPTTTALGTSAINIQATRSNATYVAAHSNAIVIGNDARTSNPTAIAIGLEANAGNLAVAIGYQASTFNNPAGAIAIGRVASAGGSGGPIAFGYGASASSDHSIGIGSSASSSSSNGVALGRNTTSNLASMVATIPFNAVYWGGQTTDATANVELNLDATATNRMTIAANTAVIADILLIANSTGAGKALSARRSVAIRRDGSNNTSLIGSVETNGTDQNTGSPTWSFTIDADDTNESLRIRVTGAASETVVWRAVAFYRVV